MYKMLFVSEQLHIRRLTKPERNQAISETQIWNISKILFFSIMHFHDDYNVLQLTAV
jgi:hypothetical protein